ncbi:MAG: hypothetical protein IPK67_06530 [Planctomycetes bacterium]|nr:hypothetical protein [Planctomycetota bacterium]
MLLDFLPSALNDIGGRLSSCVRGSSSKKYWFFSTVKDVAVSFCCFADGDFPRQEALSREYALAFVLLNSLSPRLLIELEFSEGGLLRDAHFAFYSRCDIRPNEEDRITAAGRRPCELSEGTTSLLVALDRMTFAPVGVEEVQALLPKLMALGRGASW